MILQFLHNLLYFTNIFFITHKHQILFFSYQGRIKNIRITRYKDRSSSHTFLSTSTSLSIYPCVCVSTQAGCCSGSGGVGGVGVCWRCVKVKLINLVFISWHCLCLPCSHAPIKRYRRANNYPAMLQTAPQAQYTRRVLGADQEAKSRLITSFTAVFTNSPA